MLPTATVPTVPTEAPMNGSSRGCSKRGSFLRRGQFEAAFLTAAHRDEEIEQTLDAYEKVFGKMGETR